MKSFTSILITALLPLSVFAQSPKWSCTVPDGYTHDQVVKVVNTCGPGTDPYYHILLPQDNLWACLQAMGFVCDRVNSSSSCSTTRAPAIQCRLSKPVDGLMGCGPGTWNGFVSDFTQPTTLYTLTGEAQAYQLRAAANNPWSCAQLTGFVYDKIESVELCAVDGAVAPMYHLRKPVNGLWACGPRTYNNFAYDEISGSTCVLRNVAAPSYHLRQPKADLPSGWHYSRTRVVNDCLVGQRSTQYLLE